MSNVETIKNMIEAIPDGNANMRGAVSFSMRSDEMMEIVPWLNDWNQRKEGAFNGRWDFRVAKEGSREFLLCFKATGM